ncbi:MAG: 50S ribosomal protein L11 methyltransferase [Gammaproteobacteria bacterium]|nr:50S ribosomal protein L11 methyltransferase [Gammaproteobacteria bacterium]
MPWRQLKLRLRGHELEAAEALLWERGALAVSSSDAGADDLGLNNTVRPLFELEPGDAPLWDRLRLSALFSFEAELGDLCRELRSVFPDSAPEIETLAEKQWERVWLEDFHPMQFGERLWVCPSGHAPPDPAAVNLMLDPGLAFGTGTHPTTAMCLNRLAGISPEGLSVIDYGCGSGILAIAAALLGAWPVFAVDHDARALAACRENRRRNDLTETRVMAVSPERLPALQVDLLLANILAEPLFELRERLSALVRPGGTIVLSGILEKQAEQLREAYNENFDLESAIAEGEWVLLAGRRKSGV